jgi:hypothetical protein
VLKAGFILDEIGACISEGKGSAVSKLKYILVINYFRKEV